MHSIAFLGKSQELCKQNEIIFSVQYQLNIYHISHIQCISIAVYVGRCARRIYST